MSRFVLEIGTEEIPPRFFPPALAQLVAEGQEMLERARLSFREVKVYATPRRLALVAEGVAERQAAHTREERGPAARVAFDPEGKSTKAAQGFARRHGLSPDQLVVKETDQGEYVFAVVQEPELTAREALAGRLPGLIANISFPKAMRWGTGKFRFGRPIRWLLALVDEEVVEFEIEGLPSGRKTRGHPVLAEGMYEVASASEYEACLKKLSVILDPQERWDEVVRQVRLVAGTVGGALACPVRPWGYTYEHLLGESDVFARQIEADLSLQTAFTVEHPAAALGRFDRAHLSLPRPVLEAEMIHVQGYFPLESVEAGEGGPTGLLPCFIAVRDGGEEHLDTVVRGWENVLRAKLIDASFFYEQDLKRPLADRVDDLKGVVFQEKLGTVYDKVERIEAVSEALSSGLELDAQRRDWLLRAARLCKADLTTEVVTELSDLQGVMGAIHAEKSGEPVEVSKAIHGHYRPRSAEDDPPDTTIGVFLAIADKIDTISACFAAGIVPTGSADPFALRREAMGIIKCLTVGKLQDRALHGKLSLLPVRPLAEIVLDRLSIQGVELAAPRAEVADSVLEFLAQRLDYHLREQDVRHDLVRAALAVGVDPIRIAYERGHALRGLSEGENFLTTVVACTRPINIAKGFEGGEVDPDLFQEPAEKDLWQAFEEVAARADEISLLELFQLIAEKLRAPIDRYFDDVLVMDEDEKLRRNRLAMCWQLSQLFRRIADFSLIVQA
jgi:glycyl-tRNA synthetase beta chain